VGWAPPRLPRTFGDLIAEYDAWFAANVPSGAFGSTEESFRTHRTLCDQGVIAGCFQAAGAARQFLWENHGNLDPKVASDWRTEQHRVSLKACLNGIAGECEFDLPGASSGEPHEDVEKTMRHFCDSGFTDYCGSLGSRLRHRIPSDLSKAGDGRVSEEARTENLRRMDEALALMVPECETQVYRCMDILPAPGQSLDDDPRVRRAHARLSESCERDNSTIACSAIGDAAYERGNFADARAYFEKACEGGRIYSCLNYLRKRDTLDLNPEDMFIAIRNYCGHLGPDSGIRVCEVSADKPSLDAETYREMMRHLDFHFTSAASQSR
jgi:hypothetical protein